MNGQCILQIGKMLVFQSGVMKMQLGDVLFDVLPGTEAAFRQDVAAVNTAEQACVFLGGISQRVVACPDIVHLLRCILTPFSLQSSTCPLSACGRYEILVSPCAHFC